MLCKVLVLGAVLTGASAFAQTDANDPVERSMRFVDQSLKATELYNSGKTDQSLEIFQELLARDQVLDEDGYVAFSVGDCLAVLKRIDQAKAAYELAGRLHPDLGPQAVQRIIELSLAGEITDDLINSLRSAAGVEDQSRYLANLQLGRALEKRARTLLMEAVSAFQTACGPDSTIFETPNFTTVKKLADDLDADVTKMEKRWGKPGQPLGTSLQTVSTSQKVSIVVEEQSKAEAGGNSSTTYQVTIDKDGKTQITAEGQPVKLTDAQQNLIKNHQQRINEILAEAAKEKK